MNVQEPVNVIYQTAEDGLGDTIKPRLLAAGADCSRVLVIDDQEQPLTMLDIRLEEEAGRLDGIPGVAPSEFTFFQSAKDNADVQRAYETMQNQYVLREQDRIAFSYATQELLLIEQKLLKNPAWTERTVSPQKAAEDEQ